MSFEAVGPDDPQPHVHTRLQAERQRRRSSCRRATTMGRTTERRSVHRGPTRVTTPVAISTTKSRSSSLFGPLSAEKAMNRPSGDQVGGLSVEIQMRLVSVPDVAAICIGDEQRVRTLVAPERDVGPIRRPGGTGRVDDPFDQWPHIASALVRDEDRVLRVVGKEIRWRRARRAAARRLGPRSRSSAPRGRGSKQDDKENIGQQPRNGMKPDRECMWDPPFREEPAESCRVPTRLTDDRVKQGLRSSRMRTSASIQSAMRRSKSSRTSRGRRHADRPSLIMGIRASASRAARIASIARWSRERTVPGGTPRTSAASSRLNPR